MCGRFAAQFPPEFIRRLFATKGDLPNIGPNWNVAPTQSAMVVRRHPDTGERHVDALRWGLVPHFTKDLKACKRPINARSETAPSSGMFRGALAARRCLVPADAFYEWKAMPDGKQPYAIARTDTAPLAFAGLWEGWKDPAGETLRTFTIMTTAANGDMARLHDRMPVILEQGDWAPWLGEAEGDHKALLKPAYDGVVRLWPVSRAVNSVRNCQIACKPDPLFAPKTAPPLGARRGLWLGDHLAVRAGWWGGACWPVAVELWVSGPPERPPRVWRRRATYPQRATRGWCLRGQWSVVSCGF
jgi:putative SOS response-associated peptidase YedK